MLILEGLFCFIDVRWLGLLITYDTMHSPAAMFALARAFTPHAALLAIHGLLQFMKRCKMWAACEWAVYLVGVLAFSSWLLAVWGGGEKNLMTVRQAGRAVMSLKYPGMKKKVPSISLPHLITVRLVALVNLSICLCLALVIHHLPFRIDSPLQTSVHIFLQIVRFMFLSTGFSVLILESEDRDPLFQIGFGSLFALAQQFLPPWAAWPASGCLYVVGSLSAEFDIKSDIKRYATKTALSFVAGAPIRVSIWLSGLSGLSGL